MNNVRYGKTPLEYVRTDEFKVYLSVDPTQQGVKVPPTVLGNFLEHLGYSIQGGLWAQLLSNPTFARDVNLTPRHIQELLRAGRYLTEYFKSGYDSRVLPKNWAPGLDATGFGVAAFDDATSKGIPFPWAPLGVEGSVNASVGRLGGAVRLRGTWQGETFPVGVVRDDGPSGIYQGLILPVRRCVSFNGNVWVRMTTLDESAQGQIEVGFRRRIGRRGTSAGEILNREILWVKGVEWQKLTFRLSADQVQPGEPIDFFIRWLPALGTNIDLLVDSAFLFPDDAIEGLDPDVVALAKKWPVPLLRWPGGNFVSYYHWRDGVGPIDLRPTRPNYAWHGLEYNFFGTREFIRFCHLIGAEPHITVNTGTGTPEEAAAWVEFCNGDPSTPMGRLRAEMGDVEPYHVHYWEVGNEIYGHWQGGYHGAEENARQFVAFAQAMRAVDPTIELIATGNSFDFAIPGPGYDHTHADQRWHTKLIEAGREQINYISLHCLPVNDLFLERLSNEEAYYTLMAQPATWERKFLPALLQKCDVLLHDSHQIKLAITEWGILGTRQDRPIVENYGEAVYAGLFLNMMIRNAERISIANATALLHGGCIRKVAEMVFADPQYWVIHHYAPMIGARPLACLLRAPGYDVAQGTDLGAPETDVPYVDAVVCWADSKKTTEPGLYLAIVNIHLEQSIPFYFTLPALPIQNRGHSTTIAGSDPTARATLDNPEPFTLTEREVEAIDGVLTLELPPCSVTWIHLPKR